MSSDLSQPVQNCLVENECFGRAGSPSYVVKTRQLFLRGSFVLEFPDLNTGQSRMTSAYRLLTAFSVAFVLSCGSVRIATAFEGTPTPDGMLYPLAVTVAADDTIYVADRELPGVWKFSDGKWSIYFQGSKKFRTPLNAVRCLAIDDKGKLLAGDSSTREIYRFDDNNQPQPLTNGGVGIPMSLAVAKDGTIYAGDIEIQRIVKIPAAGGPAEIIAEVTAPRGLTIDDEGRLWVVSHGNDAVIRLSADGKEREVIVEGRPFQFQHHIVLGKEGEAYVADGYAKTIWKVKKGEKPEPFYAGEPLKNPVGLAWLKGSLLIADPHTKSILQRNAEGKLTVVGATP